MPTLIFGHLLTSSNYDDTEKKVTGKLYSILDFGVTDYEQCVVFSVHRSSGTRCWYSNTVFTRDAPIRHWPIIGRMIIGARLTIGLFLADCRLIQKSYFAVLFKLFI